MAKRIVIMGAGALGGYVGGNLAHLGHDVTIVDPWPEHVETIRKRGLELLLTGDPFPPQRALEIGLVNAVVPHDELLPAARQLAQRIIRHSPDAVAAIIPAATRGLNVAISEGLQVESEQFARLVGSPALTDGLAAWRARRPPNV